MDLMAKDDKQAGQSQTDARSSSIMVEELSLIE